MIALLKTQFQTILEQPQSTLVTDTDGLAQAIRDFPGGSISYETNPSLRYIRRRLNDKIHLAFMRNTTAEAIQFSLNIDASLKACYWLDAITGNIYAAILDNATLSGWLPGYGSMALLCSSEVQFSVDDLTSGNPVQEPIISEAIPLTDWRLEIVGDDVPGGSIVAMHDALGDWSKHGELKFVSSMGTYTTTIPLDEIQPDKRYILDLGAVFAVADVTVNHKAVGHAIFSPYQVDVTDYLVSGDNDIIIEVTPPLRNRLLGKALQGDPEYAQFVGSGIFANRDPVSSGLVGPITLQIRG